MNFRGFQSSSIWNSHKTLAPFPDGCIGCDVECWTAWQDPQHSQSCQDVDTWRDQIGFERINGGVITAGEDEIEGLNPSLPPSVSQDPPKINKTKTQQVKQR